ncbi:MAG: cell envelope biogenesis protein TolA [Gammaproteobacteria bacterium]
MIRFIHGATLAALLAFSTMTTPAMARSDAADAAIDHAEAQYKAAKDKCDALKGNDEDVCKKQAKADYEKAKADAKARDKGTPAARKDAVEDKAKADYKVAKEKCEALKGQQEDACNAQAKADYERALATVKK